MEELLDAFPTIQEQQRISYKSFVFQPERVSLCSNDDVSPNTAVASIQQANPNAHRAAETFYSWKNRFQKPLRGVKSIQLLSACIPNATIMIPDDQLTFLYYRIPSLAASSAPWTSVSLYDVGETVIYSGSYYVSIVTNQNQIPTTSPSFWLRICPTGGLYDSAPNYFRLTAENIEAVVLLPTFGVSPEFLVAALTALWNRTFTDYNDLVVSLNLAAQGQAPVSLTATVPGDVKFAFNPILNRIEFLPQNAYNSVSNPGGYYYLPLGYEDKNAELYVKNFWSLPIQTGVFKPGYLLNSRLGFVWNGNFQNPYQVWPGTLYSTLTPYLRPQDPLTVTPTLAQKNVLTAQSYPDLVYTGTVRVFADVILGSSEASVAQPTESLPTSVGGLLSIVPMNSANLGISYYQSSFDNPLTKIPEIIPDIEIRLLTDSGDPFYLPNSAVVTLELAVTYK